MLIEKINVYVENSEYAYINLITNLPNPDVNCEICIQDKLMLEFVIKSEDVQEYLDKYFPNIPVVYASGD